MEKTFYLLSQKNFINNENILDVAVFIEKIIISSDSEDYKEFIADIPKGTTEEMFANYENHFLFYFDDVLRQERKRSHFEEFQIYNHLMLDEEQYNMLMKQTKDIPRREIFVNELV